MCLCIRLSLVRRSVWDGCDELQKCDAADLGLVGKEWSQFQQIVHEDTVVASDVYTVKAWNNLADDTFVCMTADERMGESVVERKL